MSTTELVQNLASNRRTSLNVLDGMQGEIGAKIKMLHQRIEDSPQDISSILDEIDAMEDEMEHVVCLV